MRWTILASILLLSGSSSAHASMGCPFLGADATKWEQAAHFKKAYGLIFEGELVSARAVEGERTLKRLRFRIIRSYKGESVGTVELVGWPDLKEDTTYLVFSASFEPCPLFIETKDAGTELRFLRGEQPEPDDFITLGEDLRRRLRPQGGSVCGKIEGYPAQPVQEPLFRVWSKKEGKWSWDGFDSAQAHIKAGSEYCIPGVNPGEYVLTLTVYTKDKATRFIGMPGSATELDGAPKIQVRPHMEARAPDLVLKSEPMFTVRGRVVLSDGRTPKQEGASILLRLDSLGSSPFDIYPAANSIEEGSFVISGVPAGRYMLRGWYHSSEYAEDGNTLLKRDEAEAVQLLTVGANVEGLTVILRLRNPE